MKIGKEVIYIAGDAYPKKLAAMFLGVITQNDERKVMVKVRGHRRTIKAPLDRVLDLDGTQLIGDEA